MGAFEAGLGFDFIEPADAALVRREHRGCDMAVTPERSVAFVGDLYSIDLAAEKTLQMQSPRLHIQAGKTSCACATDVLPGVGELAVQKVRSVMPICRQKGRQCRDNASVF